MSAVFSNEVLGPLTDAELRATPVPVSGTVTATPSGTQDVNIVSTIAVPVTDNGGSLTVDGTVGISGSVAVTGPLTDAQLRATPVPVSSTPTVTGTATVTSVSVSTTVATLQAANAARLKLLVFNEAGTLFVKLGSAATSADYTFRLTANTTLEIDTYTGIVTAIKASGTSNAQVTEL